MRPFAPAVLREQVSEWFELDTDSPYMLLVADVKKSKTRAMSEAEIMRTLVFDFPVACGRDEFAARLRKRDDEKTKKLVGEKELTDERGIALNISEEERQLIFEESRIVSRQAYLEKREDKKMQELVEAIEDEKHLFEGVELTAKEKRDFAIKQKVLKYV